MSGKIGIMQGRLVPPVDGRIQAFPSALWRDEFAAARQAGLAAIEWIFDVEDDGLNPLATDYGIAEMLSLINESKVSVNSLCADYFISQLFLKGTAEERQNRFDKYLWLLDRCSAVGIGRIVLPFVDRSKVDGDNEIASLINFLKSAVLHSSNRNIELHLETSLGPQPFAFVIDAVNHPMLKVNYDSGNSSSLGFDSDEEFAAYGTHIGSVHIKDRLFEGTTVPLGQGDADFGKISTNLRRISYTGDFILQVSRGVPGDEVNWARLNLEFVKNLLAQES